jgi:general L-amino acid transport system substrate-binding protein
VRNTTWTLTREALLKLQFPGVLFYDGQGFLVAKSSGISAIADLNGATICVEKGTTHEQHLVDYFAARGLVVKPLVIDSSAGVAEAFFSLASAAPIPQTARSLRPCWHARPAQRETS